MANRSWKKGSPKGFHPSGLARSVAKHNMQTKGVTKINRRFSQLWPEFVSGGKGGAA